MSVWRDMWRMVPRRACRDARPTRERVVVAPRAVDCGHATCMCTVKTPSGVHLICSSVNVFEDTAVLLRTRIRDANTLKLSPPSNRSTRIWELFTVQLELELSIPSSPIVSVESSDFANVV